MIEAGFEYDSSLMGDDQPHLIASDQGSLVELPVSWTLDDWPQYMHNEDFEFMMPIKAPQSATPVYEAEFEAAWQYGGLWIAIWHPFLSGRLSRVNAMLEMIERMQEKGDVWFATLEEIAKHTLEVVQSGKWSARTDRLPFCNSPINALNRLLTVRLFNSHSICNHKIGACAVDMNCEQICLWSILIVRSEALFLQYVTILDAGRQRGEG